MKSLAEFMKSIEQQGLSQGFNSMQPSWALCKRRHGLCQRADGSALEMHGWKGIPAIQVDTKA